MGQSEKFLRTGLKNCLKSRNRFASNKIFSPIENFPKEYFIFWIIFRNFRIFLIKWVTFQFQLTKLGIIQKQLRSCRFWRFSAHFGIKMETYKLKWQNTAHDHGWVVKNLHRLYLNYQPIRTNELGSKVSSLSRM